MDKYVYNIVMIYTWHEAKRKSNLRKHGFDFADVEEVFAGVTITFPDDRFDYVEERWITYGLLSRAVVAIAHVELGRATRIISFLRATKHEQEFCFDNIAN